MTGLRIVCIVPPMNSAAKIAQAEQEARIAEQAWQDACNASRSGEEPDVMGLRHLEHQMRAAERRAFNIRYA